ncbi:MAG: Tex family protein [Chloroflexota bacterium]
MRQYDQKIAARLQLQPKQVAAAISLFDDGNTVPFIARYRKEFTGSLDELKLRRVQTELTTLRKVDDRRDTIINAVKEQGKLTPQLEQQIEVAETLTELEDIYQPYKPKRRTRAAKAIEQGLEPLADMIQQQGRSGKSPEAQAQAFINDNVPTAEDALSGARDIVAERISDHPTIRSQVREKALRYGQLTSAKIKNAADERGIYESYYDFSVRVSSIRPHQTLAINRGETEKVLRVKCEVAERDWLRPIQQVFRVDRRSAFADQLELAIIDSAKRLLLPAIERDMRRTLTEQAEAHAIQVFADNLRGLLSQPPIKGQTIIGIDPGYRTGCKIAAIDDTGKVIDAGVMYLHRDRDALQIVSDLVKQHAASLIAIGNGTASRETEQLVAQVTASMDGVHYLIVNEAGASVYSASELARDELPTMDVTLRGAVSIARRVQDPLAELVKIDPKSIGVGLYQHDVNQKALSEAAEQVVESVVNQVGVELNTASPALLAYVSGIGPKLAQNIVAHRDETGAFTTRKGLKKVTGLGPKAFEQCAGFIRVRDSHEPLDASAIHPESYPTAKAVMQQAGITLKNSADVRENALKQLSLETLVAVVDTGLPTLRDIVEQLVRPGRDPRDELPPPILRSDVLTMDDLREGMLLNGTVRNVVDFGAFVDIGVKQDGLLHISQIPRGNHLSVGDVLEVKIRNVDKNRGRIGLAWG